MKIQTTLFACLFALVGAASAHSDAPSDAQIAGIVVTANSVDIEAGNLAKKMSKNKDVKAFARMMVDDHTGVNRQATALVRKLNVTPADSDTSNSLKSGGTANLAKLKALKGRAFDKAYIDNEVAYHEAVIAALDATLIPSAQNAELKETLVKVRPAFIAHLEHARHIQATVK